MLAAAASARRSPSAASPPSSPCRKAATSSAPSASCPIRAARKSRARWRRSSPKSNALADAGVREVTLIGQNVNAYHGHGRGRRGRRRSAQLLRRLADVPGIVRLRYTTSHPRDMDDDLIAAHARSAGADALCASAGAVRLRPHSGGDEPQAHAATIISTSIARLRAARPDLAFTSDFIVGFPGRDRRGFPRHAQRSSTRSASPAPIPSPIRRGRARRRPRWTTRCRPSEKAERLQRLQARDRPPAARFQRAIRRPHRDVLLEKPGRLPGQLVGRTPYLQAVQVMAPRALIGSVVQVDDHRTRAPTRCSACWPMKPARAGLGRQQELESPLAHIGSRDPGRRRLRRDGRQRNSCSPSTTTGSPRSCSANTDKTWR